MSFIGPDSPDDLDVLTLPPGTYDAMLMSVALEEDPHNRRESGEPYQRANWRFIVDEIDMPDFTGYAVYDRTTLAKNKAGPYLTRCRAFGFDSKGFDTDEVIPEGGLPVKITTVINVRDGVNWVNLKSAALRD